MRVVAWSSAFVLAASLTTPAQQPSPAPGALTPGAPLRPGASAPSGTARVSGRVLRADTGAAVSGAEVSLGGDALRRTETNADGRFDFPELPAGRYSLRVAKGGYAQPESSSPLTADPGPAIALRDGQSVERTLTLRPGGVITGRITDEFGDPVTDLEVRVERYQWGPTGRQLSTFSLGISQLTLGTNDLGEFRVFGLQPGDYLVSARHRGFGATLTTGAAATVRDAVETFLPTYYPGTTDVESAQILRLGAGQERSVRFAMMPGRMVRVSGTVINSRGLPATGQAVFLGVETSNSSAQLPGGTVSADGSFSMGSVPPGAYTLRVRAQGLGSPGNEVGSMPLVVGTEDIKDIVVTTRPGATIRGRLEWEGTSPRLSGNLRASARSMEPSILVIGNSTTTYLDPMNGTVQDDDSFELGGIIGTVLPTVGQLRPPWTLKAVYADLDDITDSGAPAPSLGGDVRVRIVLTDKVTEVNGTARDARGEPLANAVVVVLPQPARSGMGATRYVSAQRADQNGEFRVRALPPGEYVAGVVNEEQFGQQWDPDVQKTVRSTGQPFTLGDGQVLSLVVTVRR